MAYVEFLSGALVLALVMFDLFQERSSESNGAGVTFSFAVRLPPWRNG
jgi:hypothetical protein